MDDYAHDDELRLVVRRALLDMLAPAAPGEGPAVHPARSVRDESSPSVDRALSQRTEVRERELTVTLRGNERSIGLLEQALADGETALEIALDSHSGPRARVRASQRL